VILNIQNLKKNYQQGEKQLEILKGLELQVQEGESVAILGRSGSGKSTLLSLLAGLDKPTQGSIHYQGKAIETMSEADLTKWRSENMGIIFQQYHLMSTLNAFDNVALPLQIQKKKDYENNVLDLLDKVGLKQRAHHYPNQLSGGENQRVAIARALSTNPKVILADEPSGNLDQETGKNVMNMLFDLIKTEKLSLILVTHDELLAQKCDRVLRLENGVLC
jgi:putative ABC transport system ATP-binding protein